MREIKFRAWQPKFKAWVYGIFPWVYGKENANSLNMHEFWRRLSENSLEKVCRFTGLKDKNGVEIYEGDIVIWINGDDGSDDQGIIEWDQLYAGFGITGGHCLDWSGELKVIGNIHQHAHLIKGEE